MYEIGLFPAHLLFIDLEHGSDDSANIAQLVTPSQTISGLIQHQHLYGVAFDGHQVINTWTLIIFIQNQLA